MTSDASDGWTPFDPRWDFEPYSGAAPRSYLIASTQRSGSYYLSYLLRGTGQLGAPFEYLHPDHEPRWHERLGTSGLPETLHRLFRIRTSPNGWFGVKAHWDHFEYGRAQAGELLQFEKFMRIERRDRLAQAVSLALARQTSSWMSIQESRSEPRYDERKIAHALAILERDTQCWDRWFDAAGIDPLVVYYEDLAADPLGVLNLIMREFGLELVGTLPTVPTRKQASEVNEDWLRRYASPSARLKRAAKRSVRRVLRR
jgi:LPS sulfotransferase NodH